MAGMIFKTSYKVNETADSLWQLRSPTSISVQEKLNYAVRFLFCILTMESVLHTMYVVAIKDTAAWEGDSPAELSMIGFWNLVIVWLKVCSVLFLDSHDCADKYGL